MFEWQQRGNKFIATFTGGRAVIIERRRRGRTVPIGGEYSYDARLEDAGGTELAVVMEISTFEQAEEVIAAMIPAHRRHFYPDTRPELLERCQRLFDPETEAVFITRLAEIIDVLRLGYEPEFDRAPELEAIQWAATDQGWRASGPAGLELLVSAQSVAPSPYHIGARDQQFRPEIRHRSGAIWRLHYTFSELADAQNWIAEQLAMLHAPMTLPAIEFTLRICQHLIDDDGAAFGILDDLASELAGRYL